MSTESGPDGSSSPLSTQHPGHSTPRLVTFRFTEEQFRLLLGVVLAAESPDELSNTVLMACKRPKDGVIAVPVPPNDADALCELVENTAGQDSRILELARLMTRQSSVPR